MSCLDVSGLVVGGVRLEERGELVTYAEELLGQGVSEHEARQALQEYAESRRWGPLSLGTRQGVVRSAVARLRKDAGETEAEPGVVAQELVELQLVSLSEVEDEAVQWLWPGRIPLGKLTVICGETWLGKTCLSLDLAARVSAGAVWPDAGRAKGTADCSKPKTAAGRVLLLNSGDNWRDTLRPRLIGGGADIRNISVLAGVNSGSQSGSTDDRGFDLARDVEALSQRIQMLGDVRLVIIDPLEAYCGTVIRQSGPGMRSLLAPLGRLAEECGVAVVLITSGGKCELPVKNVWKVDCDVLDSELRWWVPVKFNCGPVPCGLSYRVTGDGIEWDERTLAGSADRVRGASTKQERNWRLREIAKWLHGFLAEGACPAREVLDAGWAVGWSPWQVKRAKLALGVTCRKESTEDGPWIWELDAQK